MKQFLPLFLFLVSGVALAQSRPPTTLLTKKLIRNPETGQMEITSEIILCTYFGNIEGRQLYRCSDYFEEYKHGKLVFIPQCKEKDCSHTASLDGVRFGLKNGAVCFIHNLLPTKPAIIPKEQSSCPFNNDPNLIKGRVGFGRTEAWNAISSNKLPNGQYLSYFSVTCSSSYMAGIQYQQENKFRIELGSIQGEGVEVSPPTPPQTGFGGGSGVETPGKPGEQSGDNTYYQLGISFGANIVIPVPRAQNDSDQFTSAFADIYGFAVWKNTKTGKVDACYLWTVSDRPVEVVDARDDYDFDKEPNVSIPAINPTNTWGEYEKAGSYGINVKKIDPNLFVSLSSLGVEKGDYMAPLDVRFSPDVLFSNTEAGRHNGAISGDIKKDGKLVGKVVGFITKVYGPQGPRLAMVSSARECVKGPIKPGGFDRYRPNCGKDQNGYNVYLCVAVIRPNKKVSVCTPKDISSEELGPPYDDKSILLANIKERIENAGDAASKAWWQRVYNNIQKGIEESEQDLNHRIDILQTAIKQNPNHKFNPSRKRSIDLINEIKEKQKNL